MVNKVFVLHAVTFVTMILLQKIVAGMTGSKILALILQFVFGYGLTIVASAGKEWIKTDKMPGDINKFLGLRSIVPAGAGTIAVLVANLIPLLKLPFKILGLFGLGPLIDGLIFASAHSAGFATVSSTRERALAGLANLIPFVGHFLARFLLGKSFFSDFKFYIYALPILNIIGSHMIWFELV